MSDKFSIHKSLRRPVSERSLIFQNDLLRLVPRAFSVPPVYNKWTVIARLSKELKDFGGRNIRGHCLHEGDSAGKRKNGERTTTRYCLGIIIGVGGQYLFSWTTEVKNIAMT
jgi:hypothetical protein